MPDPSPDDDPAPQGRQTLAAIVVVVLLLLGGWWLMSLLQRQREVEDCIASGRRGCVPIESFK